jgi:hypothetical protein
MTTALAAPDVDRLGKLIRLALISDEDGEMLGAIAALKRALTTAGVDAHWLGAFGRGATPAARAAGADHDGGHDRHDDDRSAAWFCWHRRWKLSPKEREFIERIVVWSGTLSEKQRKWLGDICAHLQEAAA